MQSLNLIVKLINDARELGPCSFAFQLCLFVTKSGHTRASADRRTVICVAVDARKFWLLCFCFLALLVCCKA